MTSKIELTQQVQRQHSLLRRLLWVSPASMAAAAVANLGLYAAAGAIFPQVTGWPGAGIGQIIGANSAYLFMGTIVFALIVRYSAQPARHYWIAATIGLLLSLGLPIAAGFGYAAPSAPPAEAVTVITLSLMHIISYGISTPLFIRYGLN